MMRPAQWGLLVSVAAVALVVPALSADYCSLTCDVYEHGRYVTYNNTMCLYPTAGLADSCSKVSDSDVKSKVTAAQQTAILEAHNTIRRDVKNGRYAGQGLPAAAAMPALQWDSELATVAQRWADQCTWAHDKCRRVPRWDVGQNMAQTGSSRDSDPNFCADALQGWFHEELGNFKQGTLMFTSLDDPVSGEDIGHLTQVIWAKTTHVGCGYTKTSYGIFFVHTCVCNYGPRGNMQYQNIYEV